MESSPGRIKKVFVKSDFLYIMQGRIAWNFRKWKERFLNLTISYTCYKKPLNKKITLFLTEWGS